MSFHISIYQTAGSVIDYSRDPLAAFQRGSVWLRTPAPSPSAERVPVCRIVAWPPGLPAYGSAKQQQIDDHARRLLAGSVAKLVGATAGRTHAGPCIQITYTMPVCV